MIALLLCLCAVIAGLACGLLALVRRMENMQGDLIAFERADHAKCMALISSFVGDEFAAKVLDSAAERYGSMDGQADLFRVRDGWTEGDGPIPALWMRDLADQLRRARADG